MKYVLMFTTREDGNGAWEHLSPAEREAAYGRIMEWFGRNAAVITGGEELQPAGTATTVRFEKSGPVVTDGPFIEAKEGIGGYAEVEVQDLDQAIELAKTWPGGNAVEIRPVVTHS